MRDTAALLVNIIQKSGFLSFSSARDCSFIELRGRDRQRERGGFGSVMHGVELWLKCDSD